MKKIYSSLKKMMALVIAIALPLFASSAPKQATVSAEIKGLVNDTVYVIHADYSTFESTEGKGEFITAKEGRFVYNIQVSSVTQVIFIPAKFFHKRDGGGHFFVEGGLITLFLTPGSQIEVTGSVEPNFINYSVRGSTVNETYAAHRIINKISIVKGDSLDIFQNSYPFSSKVSPTGEEWSKEEKEEFFQKIFDERRAFSRQVGKQNLAYAKANYDQDLAAYYLVRMSLDTFGVYYDKLTISVKNGIFKPLLNRNLAQYSKYKEHLENQKKIQAGVQAPDFTLKALSGKDFKLSSMKGKYVVLDFWGSWCPPCIKGFPKMKKYYEKYKSQVEFIGISCRDKKDVWRKSVEKHQLDWIQVINNEDKNKDVSVLYAVDSYPYKIILDEHRKIVAIFSGETEDFYKKLDEIFK